ncbi:MAG: 3-dehydroquinate synthase [Desulfobacteraceae bacterium]|nr:MAG: 3-dehydroquinate synthase [Desulfobacteraceae bacterium]
MPVISITAGSGRSQVAVGAVFGELARFLPPGRAVVITDDNLLRLYRSELPPHPVLSIGTGEAAKTLDTVMSLYEAMLGLEVDRTVFVLAVGGGIVCDVAGFAAATFLRGLRFGLVATTLLAQVDAAVGGKNGVNLEGYKNLVGTIRQPEFVLCDPWFLRTLPETEVVNGLAEIVKHALIADSGLFDFLEEQAEAALALEPDVIARLVGDSVRIKAAVVGRDEREAGERRLLNFGHTLGHALEAAGRFSHGEAVSVGMAFAAAVSLAQGRLSPGDYDRIIRLLERLRLPTAARADLNRVQEAVGKDKKRAGDALHFVQLEGIGQAAVAQVSIDQFTHWLSEVHGILEPAG